MPSHQGTVALLMRSLRFLAEVDTEIIWYLRRSVPMPLESCQASAGVECNCRFNLGADISLV